MRYSTLIPATVASAAQAGCAEAGEIRRSDYGLDFGAGLLGDVVKVQLDMQFVEPVGQEG